MDAALQGRACPCFSTRVLNGSRSALIAGSVLDATVLREKAKLSSFALRPCREPPRGD